MNLSSEQVAAVDLLCSKPVLGRLGGYAGTGKTACIGRAVARRPDLLVLTPTHRGRMALAAAGVDARTIHAAICQPIEARPVAQIEADLEAARLAGDRAREEKLRAELRRDVSFCRREETDAAGRDVIVDEASMVGARLLADLQAAGPRSIVLVGDPAQLPPVGDDDVFRSTAMDVTLTEVWRHEGWILDAATAVREQREDDARRLAARAGRLLPWSRHTEASAAAAAEDAGRIEICWTNRMRQERARRLLVEANAPRARVRCEMNQPRWQTADPPTLALTGLPEGEMADASAVRNGDLGWLIGQPLHIRMDAGGWLPVAASRFAWGWDSDRLPPKPGRGDLKGRWLWHSGSVVTCHRAQGGQWQRVWLIDEYPSDRDGRARWLYTAMTRARSDLIWWEGC